MNTKATKTRERVVNHAATAAQQRGCDRNASDSLSQFLQDLRGDGGLFLLGGHYEFPGVPSPGAVDSARLVADLQDLIGSNHSLFRLFLNDIGASLACVPGFQCSIAVPESFNELADVSTEWLDLMPSVERTLVADPSKWRTCADSISRCLGDVVQSDLVTHPLVRRLTTPERFECIDFAPIDWLTDLELLMYASAKSRFRPLQLTVMAQKLLPPVFFEKTMNNGASRLLHKLLKKPQTETGLRVSNVASGTRDFTVVGPDRTEIQLRREEASNSGGKASNKCAALLAQLFAYSCKQISSTFRVKDRITVCYFIPCYDRGRLFHGMHTFCELFTDISHYFGVEEITLCSGFFMTPDHSVVKCDTFIKRGSRAPTVRTVRLAREIAQDPGS